jgi:putative transposase
MGQFESWPRKPAGLGCWSAVMPKRHANAEILAKLAQAKQLAAEGKSQSEIALALGISVMTYHRWRNSKRSMNGASPAQADVPKFLDKPNVVAELRLENLRLRRLVTDLLLEKLQLQETFERAALAGQKTSHI